MKKDIIEVAFCVDRNMFDWFMICLDSIRRTAAPSDRYRIHLVIPADPGITLTNDALRALETFNRKSGFGIIVYRIKDVCKRFGVRLPQFAHVTTIAWMKLVLPDILLTVPKVIYLDSDIVVRRNLRRMWDEDLHGRIFGAVQTSLPNKEFPDYEYQTGHYVIDLQTARLRTWTDRMRSFLQGLPADQLARSHDMWTFNKVVRRDEVQNIPARYGFSSSWVILKPKALPALTDISHYNKKDETSYSTMGELALSDVVVMHYHGPKDQLRNNPFVGSEISERLASAMEYCLEE